MNRIFDISPNVFPVTLTIATGTTKYLKSRLKEEHHEDVIEVNEGGANAITISDKGRSLIIIRQFDDSPEQIGIIAHEVYHAVTEQLEWIGVNDSETFAYMTEFYTGSIIKRLRLRP